MPAPIRHRRTAGFSYSSRPIYVSFTGNKVPFNVDIIRAVESLWLDIKTSDGEGSVAPKVRDVSYSSPLTYGQEKTGDVREAVARIDVPEGYEAQYFAAIRKNITGFDITLLPEYRKAETQKGTPSRGRSKRLPLGLGLRSSSLTAGYDKAAAVSTLQSMLNAATRAGSAAKANGATDKVKAFKTYANGGNGGRKDLIKSLGEPYASQVKEAFFAAFDGAKTGAAEAADPLMRAIQYCGTGSLQYHKTREGAGYCNDRAWDSKNVVSTSTVDSLCRQGLMEGYPSPSSRQYVHLTQAGKDALASGQVPQKRAALYQSDRAEYIGNQKATPELLAQAFEKAKKLNYSFDGDRLRLNVSWKGNDGYPTEYGSAHWITQTDLEGRKYELRNVNGMIGIHFLDELHDPKTFKRVPITSARKVADFTMQDVITKMLKDFKVMQQAIGSIHSQVHGSEGDLNHDLTAQVDPLNKKAMDFLASLEKFDTFLKTPPKTSSLKTAGMGKSEYLRRLRDLKAKLNHLMSDAAVSGTAPKNLRKAEASLEAEITEIKGVKTEEAPEEPIAPAKKK